MLISNIITKINVGGNNMDFDVITIIRSSDGVVHIYADMDAEESVELLSVASDILLNPESCNDEPDLFQ